MVISTGQRGWASIEASHNSLDKLIVYKMCAMNPKQGISFRQQPSNLFTTFGAAKDFLRMDKKSMPQRATSKNPLSRR